MSSPLQWHPLLLPDLDRLAEIAALVHPGLPERPEVFAEKARLCPEGCRKLVRGNQMMGYALAHPWKLHSIPALDAFLGNLPAEPDCIYLHDIAILPEARGHDAAGRYLGIVKHLAASLSISSLALVSVYGTDRLWSRFGFRAVEDEALAAKLRTYGSTAKYMVAINWEGEAPAEPIVF